MPRKVEAKSDKKEKVVQAAPVEQAEQSERRRLRKFLDGIVVSNKMSKTAVVAVTRQVKHGQYGKYVNRTKKYLVHDEKNECGAGDLVRIVGTRPLSATKRFRLHSILRKAA